MRRGGCGEYQKGERGGRRGEGKREATADKERSRGLELFKITTEGRLHSFTPSERFS